MQVIIWQAFANNSRDSPRPLGSGTLLAGHAAYVAKFRPLEEFTKALQSSQPIFPSEAMHRRTSIARRWLARATLVSTFSVSETAMSRRSHVCSLVAALAAVCVPGIVVAAPTGVTWRDNVDAAKIEAAQSGRLVLLHFYTRTCAPCKLLDQNVLSQPHVGLAVEREYVPVKIDADASPALASMYLSLIHI